MRWSSRLMRSTRSSALRCPSCLRNALTIRSRLLDRLVPAGRRRSRSGMAGMAMTRSLGTKLCREGRTAAAGRRRVRILDREAAARDRVDEINFRAAQIADADRIDEQAHAVRFERLIAHAARLFDHQPVLEARAAAALHEHAQAAFGFALFAEQLANLPRS